MKSIIIDEQIRFFSTKITEEFVWRMKVLFWTTVAVLAASILMLFIALYLYLVKI